MNDTTRFSRIVRVAVALPVLMLSGCGGDGSPGGQQGDEDEHAGHVIPAHKPRNFPQAVRRLRELNDGFSTAVISSRPDAKDLEVASDISGWLPEIAADSDMPEREWNEVHARAGGLVAKYREILVTSSGHARMLVAADADIGRLEQVLRSSDPRWFGGTNRDGVAR